MTTLRQPSSRTTRPTPAASAWWQRPGLGYRRGRLHLGNEDLERLAHSSGQPTYAYHAKRVRDNLERLRATLRRHAPDGRVFYAMKANRFVPLLGVLRAGQCGIDACSPREVLLARQCGFAEDTISYTATAVSDEDLAVLRRHPDVWINCDSLSMIRRLGQLIPGREIGIRINPGIGVGYRANRLVRYAGRRPTKFGIHESEFNEALRLAAAHKLRVTGLHVHAGCGYLTPQLAAWQKVLESALGFAAQVPGLRHLNVGGGLGIPLVADDEPLDLDAWGHVLARTVVRTGLQVWVEPGDYLVKDSGVLLLQVNTVETKRGTRFVGVNGGFNLHIEPAFYQLPLEPVPCREPVNGARWQRVTIAGNINEALDLLATDVPLPPIAEGDWLAFLNAGGYGAAMSSNHCLRGEFAEYLV